MGRLTVLDTVAWDGRGIPGDRTVALLRALVDAGPDGLSEDRLVDEVWTDGAPANPRKALQVVVSRARSATSADVIERTRSGYRLSLGPDEVDAWALAPEGLRLAAQGRYAEALPKLERSRPDEHVMVALLRSLAAVRGVPAALERYESYRKELAESFGVDPSPELRAEHAALLAADRPVRSGVRYEADRLIGREADVAALEVLVRTHRIVSIIGTGGLGKTRLANVIARSAEQPVVHVVELAGVTSPEGVAIEVADALGVREAASSRPVTPRPADLLTRLVDALDTVPTLLVLDNCEHLVAAAAHLVDILVTRTPRLTVLTTTRIPLGLPAERAYLLPELSPDDAVALFAERATAARPTVVLDDAEVHELVARLDGLPLALELAAAKVRSMSVAEITRRLDNRFSLLRGGSRTAPERHQTLLAVIDWSWNLLTEEQRVALRRLVVFRDGFSLDGATAILGSDAHQVVTALVEHSLIVVDETAGLRYRLLETVREFGRMQLVDAGDDPIAEERLRAWAMALARRAGTTLHGRDQVATVRLLRSEEGNLVDVLRRGLADAELPVVAVVFAAMAAFWMIEGSHLKVLNLAPAITDLLLAGPTPEDLADATRASLATAATNEMIFRGSAGERALDRLRELGPGPIRAIASVVRLLLEIHSGGGGVERLTALGDDADPALAQLALVYAAHVYENAGQLAAARDASRRALALCDDEAGPWMRGLVSASASGLALDAGDLEEAGRRAQEAIPILRDLGASDDHAQAKATLAMIALHEGRLDEAERILDELSTEEGGQSIFGAALARLCGRAELLLARGLTEAGLAAYADAVAVIRGRAIAGHNLPAGFEPWVMLPQAALLAASVRAGRRAQDARDDLLAKATAITGVKDVVDLDVPVLGCTLFALAVWEVTFGSSPAGSALLGYADRFAFNRMLPTFDRGWATSLAQPSHIPEGGPTELRESIHAVLYTLRP